MAAEQERINSLLIPITDQNVLIPQTGLAEVIPREMIQPLKGVEPWLRGMIQWRGQQIPTISVEEMCGRHPRASKDSRYVVLYAIEQIPGLQWYALEVSGIPHPLRLTPDQVIKGGTRDADCEIVAANVIADGQEAVILDPSVIERRIGEQLARL
ncbi:MAG: chemotaxis protein CheW, partial [Gammaproteobacteria bacterium]